MLSGLLGEYNKTQLELACFFAYNNADKAKLLEGTSLFSDNDGSSSVVCMDYEQMKKKQMIYGLHASTLTEYCRND